MLSVLDREDILIKGRERLVRETTRECLLCHLTSNRYRSSEMKMVMKPNLSGPYRKVFIDLVTFQIETQNREHAVNCLTMVDDFSCRLTYRFVRNKTAAVISKRLLELTCEVGGLGQMEVFSDNGLEFVASKTQDLLEYLQMHAGQISPTNARANKVERCHKSIRDNLRAIALTESNVQHKFDLAVSTYNHQVKSSLDMMTPMEVFGIKPPRYFSAYLQHRQNESKCDSIREFTQNINILFKNLASFKLNRYLFKSEDSTPLLSEGDIVVLKENSLRKHDPGLSGPYVITNTRSNNCHDIENLFTSQKLMRNGRFLRKVHLSEEDKKNLTSKNLFIRKSGHILFDDNEIDLAKSSLEQEPEFLLQPQESKTKPKPKSDSKVESSYNLRKR
ncbi:Oidioi.mRNA.OKI2018_I69.chr1.g1710.t1.cds [Oikopleura dioica]|uniref:Oidioi.mRNA.OKI2018_I69.chr1.g1709.t1.cds n=1 Tax=Oikopleura dioica TaxID=34765 RepID=A0ABN7SQE7_OIKDI|nr:Oidioi.mRNA.OKI2018_I69.chr1.g1709.t1.cds [Oikopleura dioica]CAG5104961.1 Oidioi.mRNA.OKI2018_I69.chr1.g1710.t1.cds [Oikopleura dioica]